MARFPRLGKDNTLGKDNKGGGGRPASPSPKSRSYQRDFEPSAFKGAGPKGHRGLSWLPVSRSRVGFIKVVSLLVLGALIVRLSVVSLAPSTNYRLLAAGEGYSIFKITPSRGTIFDSSGNVLAVSEPRYTVVADPLQVKNPIAESQILSSILAISPSVIRAHLVASGQFQYIAHQITQSQTAKINKELSSLAGIALIQEPLRVRPNQAMAASVIGGVSTFNGGVGGIEQSYNSLLTGTPGTELVNTAPSGGALPGGTKILTPSRQGKNLTTTLNTAIQLQTETALSNEMVATQARAGVAIVMNPTNGNILAMANLVAGAPPTSSALTGEAPINLPQPKFTFTQQSSINMAVDYVYEPGSVAKIATFAAALSRGIITPGTEMVVPDQIIVGGTNFHDAEVHPPTIMTPKDILAQSSNVGTITIASHLTPHEINASFRNFGWGVASGLNLPGESLGFLDPSKKWSGTAPGSAPIGQDEAVTPLQVIDSYNAIANGGVMATPRLVQAVGTTPAKVIKRRVISKPLASVMTGLLSGVTGANGTAPAATVSGFSISGKTGTASIAYPNGRAGYIPHQYMATFVGFTTDSSVPLSEMVVLTEPNQLYGGLTAAKVFSSSMTYALYHLGAKVVAPSTPPSSSIVTRPTVNSKVPGTAISTCSLPLARFGASLIATKCLGTTQAPLISRIRLD
ncbi:penicillin-binding protein 2 [Acidithrix sp. C25]|uniref:peptidoglycan D,D-transpeptidase FtsI family protein n=1 Tax=Acidithrix sp. C25 TaxID=1671482 RepID=UPI00191BAB5B|nr:penicillin-binding protein 2 [Acidithrix sp. C25]